MDHLPHKTPYTPLPPTRAPKLGFIQRNNVVVFTQNPLVTKIFAKKKNLLYEEKTQKLLILFLSAIRAYKINEIQFFCFPHLIA